MNGVPRAQGLGHGEHHLAPEVDVQDGGVLGSHAAHQRQGARHAGHGPQHHGAQALQLLAQVLGDRVLVLDHEDAATTQEGRGRARTQGGGLRHRLAPLQGDTLDDRGRVMVQRTPSAAIS